MNVSLSVTADFVGSSFANDPELALPTFPRFPAEILVLPYQSTGLLFEGARGTQVLNGRGARGFLPRLIARLDGTRPLAELVHAFPPMAPKVVFDALALLYSRGLLEDGNEEVTDGGSRCETLSFFGRYTDATRINDNRHEALRRIAAARVALVGSPELVGPIEAALADLEGASLAKPADVASVGSPDLMIAAFVAGDEKARTWLDGAWAAGIPTLHAAIGKDAVEVGPVFVPGKSACPDCLRARRPAEEGGLQADDLGFWAGVIALQAHHLLSRVGNPTLYNVCHVHSRTEHGTFYEDVKLARLPGCAACGLGDRQPSARDPESVVWLLHNAANAMPPQSFLSPRDYQMHYAAANLQITKEVPDPWWGAEPVALPEGALPEAAPAWSTGAAAAPRPLDLDSLATLLRCAVGQHVGEGRRVTPSAGGLGSAELFVVVRDLAGIEPGVYRYYAVEHRLERLGVVPDGVLAGALGVALWQLPPVTLVGVCNTTKLQQKYNDFTFRFAALDSGVVRLFLSDAADALGLTLGELPRTRDSVLADALALPTLGNAYFITFAMRVGGDAPGTPRRELVRQHQHVARLVALASDADVAGEGPPPAPAFEPVEATATLGELMRRRQSVRRYADRAVELGEAVRIARMAMAALDRLSAAGALSVKVRPWLAMGHQSGDAAGIYGFDSALQPTRLRAGLVPDDLHALMLQHALAEAPVVLLFTGDFGHAVDSHGARGYREMIARAGAAAARALLVAEARGLRGCPWGGLTEDGWGPLLGIDRYGDCPLFGLSLGYGE